MERRIDFSRERHMLCGLCHHRWTATPAWLDRWEQGDERCPGCGVTCEHEDAPRVTVDPDDAALDDGQIARLHWYHTSTRPDWPTRDPDPAAILTSLTRQRMGGPERVDAWAARQATKALHIGTYESAVENMLRRIRNQGDRGRQFYLYRVRLKPSVAVAEGWLIDPSNFVGDVWLNEICDPGVDVARYLNYHEDAGSVSLAIDRSAISTVQRVAVPLLDEADDRWLTDTAAAVARASGTAAAATADAPVLKPLPSPRAAMRTQIARELTERLPPNLQDEVSWAMASEDGHATGDEPAAASWARWCRGLVALIENPTPVLAALDAASHRAT